MFPNIYIKIERLVGGTLTDVGSSNSTKETIQEKLFVSILEDTSYRLKNEMNYNEAGQTSTTIYAISCNTFIDIREKDIITIVDLDGTPSNLKVGDKLKVTTKPYVGALIPHVRATAKLGVL